MKSSLAVFAILFCPAGIVSAADQQLVGLMMPDAKVLAGINVANVRTSPFGHYLLSQVPTGDANFQQFVLATGFDPTRDITEVVAASVGAPGQQSGLLAARGTFDVAHIVTFVQTMGAKVDQSQGVPVIASPDGKGVIAFLDNTLAIAGDADSVSAALGRRGAPGALDPALVTKGQALSQTADVWAVSTITPGLVGVPDLPKGPGGLDLSALQSIQQSSAGVKFGTTVTVTGEAVADTAQNANMLADVVRLLVALGQMNQSNPQAAQLTALLKNLTIQTTGTAVDITLAVPEDLLEQLSPKQEHKAHRAAAERQKHF